jgi:hypothetical protein
MVEVHRRQRRRHAQQVGLLFDTLQHQVEIPFSPGDAP